MRAPLSSVLASCPAHEPSTSLLNLKVLQPCDCLKSHPCVALLQVPLKSLTCKEVCVLLSHLHLRPSSPPWRPPRDKSMVYSVNSHTNATRIGWYLWEIDL